MLPPTLPLPSPPSIPPPASPPTCCLNPSPRVRLCRQRQRLRSLIRRAYAPIYATAADQLHAPSPAAPGTGAVYAAAMTAAVPPTVPMLPPLHAPTPGGVMEPALSTGASGLCYLPDMSRIPALSLAVPPEPLCDIAYDLAAQLANGHAQLVLLRAQGEAYKAALVQHAASMAIERAQLVRTHRHATYAVQRGQLTTSAAGRRKEAHDVAMARIDASLPQRFDPPLSARYSARCLEVQFGLRSVGEVMTLRGTPARAAFRPARFPQQGPLRMRRSTQAKAACATWTRGKHGLALSEPRVSSKLCTSARQRTSAACSRQRFT
jgi:hypothetical protein